MNCDLTVLLDFFTFNFSFHSKEYDPAQTDSVRQSLPANPL